MFGHSVELYRGMVRDWVRVGSRVRGGRLIKMSPCYVWPQCGTGAIHKDVAVLCLATVWNYIGVWLGAGLGLGLGLGVGD